MPKYQPSDDGKIIEGKVVVYMSGPQALALVMRSAQGVLARATVAMLAEAAKAGTPFCEECEHAKGELAAMKAQKR